MYLRVGFDELAKLLFVRLETDLGLGDLITIYWALNLHASHIRFNA